MQFSRLRISGFKSFCDPVELMIDDGLTGIVGPNGCGKSNIVEAVRWVMGESSAKGLRGTEMDDVIFSGSMNRPRFNIAEVSLSVDLNNAEPQVSEPETEQEAKVIGLSDVRAAHWISDPNAAQLEITRKIARSTGSSYALNHRECRARDVQLIFADARSGSRNPSIISQGSVAFIVEAKPEERRRLLEDAAGIGGMHTRRREAELKLSAADTNLKRVGDRFELIKDRLLALSEQAEQASIYRDLSAKIEDLEGLIILSRYWQRLQAFEREKQKQAHWRNEKFKAEDELGRLNSSIKELEAVKNDGHEREQVLTIVVARLEEQSQRHQQAKEHYERELEMHRKNAAEIQQRLTHNHEVQERQKEQLEELDRHIAHLEPQLEELDRRLTDSSGKLAIIQERKIKTAGLLEDVEPRHQELQHRIALLNQQNLGAQRRLNELEGELKRVEDVDDFALVPQALRNVETTKVEFEQLQGEERALQSAYNKLRSRSDQLRSELRSVDEKLTGLKSNEQQQTHELSTINQSQKATLERLALTKDTLDQHSGRLDQLRQQACEIETSLNECHHHKAEEELQKLKEQHKDLSSALTEAEKGLEKTVEEEKQLETSYHETDRSVRVHEAELKALSAIEGEDCAMPVLTTIDCPQAWSRALAAALGDELLLGLEPAQSYWRILDRQCECHWPENIQDLASLVKAHPAILNRLKFVGIARDEQYAHSYQHRLEPGQSLVTKDGDVWRWDGLVQKAQSTDKVSIRLQQRQKIRELQQLLLQEKENAANLKTELAACSTARTASKLHLDELRRQFHHSERAVIETDAERNTQWQRFETLTESRKKTDAEALELEPQVEKLRLEYEALNDGYTEIDTRLLEQHLAQIKGDISDLDGLQHEQAQILEGTLKELKQSEEGLKEKTRRLEKARSAFNLAQITFERREVEAQTRDAHRKGAKKQLEENKSSLQQSLLEQNQDLLKDQAVFDQLSGERETLKNDEAALIREEKELQSMQHDQQIKKSAGQARLAGWQQAHGRIKDELGRLEEEKKGLIGQKNSLAETLQNLEANGDKNAENDGMGAELAKARQDLTQISNEAVDIQRRLDELLSKRSRLASIAKRSSDQLLRSVATIEQYGQQLTEYKAKVEEKLNRPLQSIDLSDELKARLEKFDIQRAENELSMLRRKRDELGPVNLRAAQEIEEAEAEQGRHLAEIAELKEAIEKLNLSIATLNREAKRRLKDIFDEVDTHFRKLFTELFQGGRANLRLTNLDNPAHAGLELDVMPPGKKLQSLSLLSGGEKSLTALALIFAFFMARPSPLCVLDEVDAALDDSNVERFVSLMKTIAKRTGTRFLVVTHHPYTMASMARLYGVTMIEKGVSRLVSVSLEDAVAIRETA